VLPERLIHASGNVIPGQFGGQMGPRRDPWFIEAAPRRGFSAELNSGSTTYGAYPEYAFDFGYEFDPARARENARDLVFQAPSLTLPEGLDAKAMSRGTMS
jgi:hypothetical protein